MDMMTNVLVTSTQKSYRVVFECWDWKRVKALMSNCQSYEFKLTQQVKRPLMDKNHH